MLAGSAGQGPSADLGDTIDQSLRFSGSQYLTGPTGTSTSTYTFSAWVKKAFLQTNRTSGYILGLNTNGNGFGFYTDQLSSSLPSYYSAARFRDPSSWYHVVANTTGQYWINGEAVSDSPSSLINPSNDAFVIGTLYPAQASSYGWVGQIAQVYLVDGQELDADDFGKYNEDGVWVPQDYSGSYGTNGFKLTFDSSQTNGIGHDSSGNGNDFTASGFETTAISSSNFDNDIDYEDTPTSNYGTANPVGTTVSAFTKANLEVGTTSSGTWQGAYGTFPIQSGKWYWEMEVGAADGMIGVSSNHRATPTYSSQTGEYAFRVNGSLYNNGSSSSGYSSAASSGDIIGVAFDADSGTLWYSINGTWANSATQSEIEAGTTTNSANTGMPDALYVPFFSNINTPAQNYNFGQRPFIYTKPNGYNALDSNNLPEPTIKNGKDHFEAIIWDGDGNDDRDITTTESFQPDFVWIKRRSSTLDHGLFDSVRGGSKILYSNLTIGEDTSSVNIKQFNSDGFRLGTGAQVNASGQTYVAWCWKAGGTAVSNTDGTITSSVSVNTDAGFSIVSYTGNATNGATVGHGLGVTPEFIILKDRDTAVNWIVYNKGVDSTNPEQFFLHLNSDVARQDLGDVFNDVAPGSSVFTLGNSTQSNGNTKKYIAYCWHSVEGFSKFGSYETNVNSNGPFVYLGFKPALIILKNIDETTSVSWKLADSTRAPANLSTGIRLYAASDAAESTHSNEAVDFLSNGFKIRGTSNSQNAPNVNKTVIYMAWAENPFGGENAPPATAR
jgi:hypothetical protein